MPTFILSVIPILRTLLLISLAILFHEAGHLLTALNFNINVQSFNLGFGPSLYSYIYNDIIFSLNSIPLGGYVDLGSAYRTTPYYQQLMVSISGPLVNISMALLLFKHKEMIKFFSYLSKLHFNPKFDSRREFFATFSLIIGLFNLLPFSPLDGGSMVYASLSLFVSDNYLHIYNIISVSIALLLLIIVNLSNLQREIFKTKLILFFNRKNPNQVYYNISKRMIDPREESDIQAYHYSLVYKQMKTSSDHIATLSNHCESLLQTENDEQTIAIWFEKWKTEQEFLTHIMSYISQYQENILSKQKQEKKEKENNE